MTVEQPALPQHKIHAQRPRDAESLLFAKVKEVTGVNDDMVIRRACEACRDSNGKVKVEDVVTVLLNDDSVHTKTKSKMVAFSQKDEITQCSESQPGQSTINDDGKPNIENESASGKQDVPYGPLNKNQGVIDLTSDNSDQDDIQKAIAASLQETQGILAGQLSREEQDISRTGPGYLQRLLAIWKVDYEDLREISIRANN